MLGSSWGAGPGGQTGICLLGTGGHDGWAFILSRLIADVRGPRLEVERWGAIGRGRAIVAIVGSFDQPLGSRAKGEQAGVLLISGGGRLVVIDEAIGRVSRVFVVVQYRCKLLVTRLETQRMSASFDDDRRQIDAEDSVEETTLLDNVFLFAKGKEDAEYGVS